MRLVVLDFCSCSGQVRPFEITHEHELTWLEIQSDTVAHIQNYAESRIHIFGMARAQSAVVRLAKSPSGRPASSLEHLNLIQHPER